MFEKAEADYRALSEKKQIVENDKAKIHKVCLIDCRATTRSEVRPLVLPVLVNVLWRCLLKCELPCM
jgi:hypothetical protein